MSDDVLEDQVERLLDEALSFLTVEAWSGKAGFEREALKLKARLRIKAAIAALTASRSYSDEIVDALEPFAKAADQYEAAPALLPSGLPDGWTCSVKLRDLRKARSVFDALKVQTGERHG